jgi:Zn-dependent protease
LDSIERFLLFAPVLLFSVVAHEYAHGYAALRQGDNTAYMLGRLTWNPIKHIDPFLTILLPIATFAFSGGSFIFGGAKPVPVNPRNYKHYKRSDIIVSLAGIAVNLALVPLIAVAIVALGLLGRGLPVLAESISLLQLTFQYGILINLVLAIFNLLPVPPLDGSHVMKYLLPPAWSLQYQRLAGAGFFILILLLWIGRPIINAWMAPVFFFARLAFQAVAPWVIQSSWTQ